MFQINNIVYTDLLIFCIIINIILYIFLYKQNSNLNYSTKLFRHFILSISFIAFIESLSWLIDIEGSLSLRPYNYFINAIFLSFNTLPAVFGLRYMDYKVFVSIKKNRHHFFLYLLPIYLNICFMIYNIFNDGFLFSIDSSNQYNRGNATYIGNIFAFIVTLIAVIYFLQQKNMITGRITQAILSLIILPVAGAILQMLFYGLSLGIPAYSVAALICFLLLEREEQLKDQLTHLSSRTQMERRLQFKLKSSQAFTTIVVDANDFKKINDIFGHSVGDKVLKDISRILLSATNPEDMVCRYGGDEFVIILETAKDIGHLFIQRVDQDLSEYYSDSPYSITLSYGFLYIDHSTDYTVDEVIHIADQKMYEYKINRKK